MSTSLTSGFVLASSSGVASLNMGMLKNRNEVKMLRATIAAKLITDAFKVSTSFTAIEKPIPRIGPIRGEISIAPITTAVELTFNPIEAIRMEKTRIHAVCPLMDIPSRMRSAVASLSVPSLMVKSLGRYSFRL